MIFFFFVVVTKLHTIKKFKWGEVLCIQLFIFTNQDNFFLPQKKL